MSEKFDRIDLHILKLLQADSHQPVQEVADRVGLSKSACHRRIQNLEGRGVITGYAAVLDPAMMGMALRFVVEVRLNGQSEKEMMGFEKAVQGLPEVLECQLMAGQIDYVLRVAVRDVSEYEAFHQRLAQTPGVATVASNLALRTVKPWVGVPIP